MDRKIYLIGTIDEAMVERFAGELDALNAESSKPIEVELSSEGGTHYASLAIVGRIRNSKAPVHVKAYGYIMSAAVLILACADKRFMCEHAWVMVHEDSGKVKGSTSDLAKQIEQMGREEEQWCRLMDRFSRPKIADWAFMSLNTTYLTAQDCLDYGLIDFIMKGKR